MKFTLANNGSIKYPCQCGCDKPLRLQMRALTAHDGKTYLLDSSGNWYSLVKDDKLSLALTQAFEDAQMTEEAKKQSDAEWQVVREEGKKRGERDAVDGVTKLYATIVECLRIHPQQPYWEGYVKGYEEIREAIKNESKTTD